MARNLVGHARNGLDLENSLRLGAEGNSRFERVLDAMVAKELKEIGRVLVNDDVAAGNVNSESIREEFFSFLDTVSNILKCFVPDIPLQVAYSIIARDSFLRRRLEELQSHRPSACHLHQGIEP